MIGADDITDDELAELAMAADPDDVEIDADAVPFGTTPDDAGLLPSWYMPVPMAGAHRHRRRQVGIVAALVAALLAVNAVGLCITYGIPEVGDRIVSFR